MTKKTKDRLVIIGCFIGIVIAAIDIIWAVINIVLFNLGKPTIFYNF